MKITIATLLVAVFVVSSVHAGFKPRRGEFMGDSIEEALKTAKAEARPLIVIYGNPDSTCGLARGMFNDVYDEFRRRGLILILRSRNNSYWEKVPDTIKNAISSPDAGRYSPTTIIMTPDSSGIIAFVPYARDRNERRRSFLDARRNLSEFSRTGYLAGAGMESESRTWRDIYGNTVEGRLVSQTSTHVVLNIDDNDVEVDRAMLSPEDRHYLMRQASANR